MQHGSSRVKHTKDLNNNITIMYSFMLFFQIGAHSKQSRQGMSISYCKASDEVL